MPEILVVIEHRKQRVADISLQMLSKGRQLADRAGADLLAVAIGSDVVSFSDELTRWADSVLAVENLAAGEMLAEPSQEILSSVIRERKPFLVLMGHSSFGIDLAPALAIELGTPLITDCIDISLVNGSVRAIRSLYNGKVNAVYSFTPSETIMVTGRIGEFPVEEGNREGKVEWIDFSPEEKHDFKRFEGYTEQEAAGVDITQAEVLISVGRGIKDKSNIEVAERLAHELGGVLACSRPVADYGWLPAEYQVGLSGKTVNPKLYLALGISGAFQHIVGMKGAKMIIAVNRDNKAPIFRVADYGIVDDIFKVIPLLVQKISELRN
ncbi:MAG TPA: electron transfer flavoprotein subunit alpha/FixB family protein [Dehalococcoidia bacterium]|nr:electron transfer flavoprotein subunit alpha/FixB family protein [Dehalococcoidia bacterium]